MRGRLVCALVAIGLGFPGAAAAAVVNGADGASGTTGGATSVTSTSAVLNGLAVSGPGGASWGFEYGTSSSYGSLTKSVPLAAGLTALSESVSGLTPATKYHYRLYVLSGPVVIGVGTDSTFVTAPAVPSVIVHPVGQVRLADRRIRAVGQGLRVRLSCSGATGSVCAGIVGVSAVRKGAAPLFCAVGSVSLGAGVAVRSVSLHETAACAAALRAAGKHDLSGQLAGTFPAAGASLVSAVTLVPAR